MAYERSPCPQAAQGDQEVQAIGRLASTAKNSIVPFSMQSIATARVIVIGCWPRNLRIENDDGF
jgi:hypothetical protein